MGANIGTTLTAWIMSLGYNVDLTNVVFPAFFLGMVLIYYKRHRYVGDFLFGIAFMFLSLVMLSSAGKEMDLAHNESVVNFFASFDTGSHLTILAFLAIGTLITCIVQSSAAVMAITILLCSTGVLPIYLGIALVMGENIGTTATANLAALGAAVQCLRRHLGALRVLSLCRYGVRIRGLRPDGRRPGRATAHRTGDVPHLLQHHQYGAAHRTDPADGTHRLLAVA